MTTFSACRTSIPVLNPRTTQFRIVMFRIGCEAVPRTEIPSPVVSDDVIDRPSIVTLLEVITIGPEVRADADGTAEAPASKLTAGTAPLGAGARRATPPNGTDQ